MKSEDSSDSDSEDGAASLSSYPGASDVGPGVDSDTGSGVDSDPEMSSFEHDEEAFVPDFEDLIESEEDAGSDQEVSSFEHDEEAFVVAPFYILDEAEDARDGNRFWSGFPDAAVGVVFQGDIVAPVGSEVADRMEDKLFTQRVEPGDSGFEDCIEIWGEHEA